MITPEEEAEIVALEEEEMDFYAPLMFLCLSRLAPGRSMEMIREIVANAYRDLNLRNGSLTDESEDPA